MSKNLNGVYKLSTIPVYGYDFTTEGTYQSLLTEYDENQILQEKEKVIYELREKKVLRLENLEKLLNSEQELNEIILSEVSYADLLVGLELAKEKERTEVDSDEINEAREIMYTSEIFSENNPNVLAISVMVKDKSGKYLLTKRNKTVLVGENYIATSITGTFEREDYCGNATLMACILRNIYEEVGLPYEALTRFNLDEVSLVYGTKKKQPVVICNASVDLEFDKPLLDMIETNENFVKQNVFAFVKTKEEIESELDEYNLTQIGKYHLSNLN